MDTSKITRTTRRWRNLTLVGLLSLITYAIYAFYGITLRHTGYFTGWTLFTIILVLTLFNARKKIPYLPLLNASQWLQVHIYMGLFSGFLFLVHINMRLPTGPFENFLSVLFILVFGSGIAGLFLSRIIPRRLMVKGEEVLFERIPIFRHRLEVEVQHLIEKIINDPNATAIAEFHTHRLIPYFAGPRYIFQHLIQSEQPRYILLNELNALSPYLNNDMQPVIEDLTDLIETKDNLDYHYAHQALLKYWLFTHIPLTYSLLLVILVHVVVVYAFLG